jgi:hypothetical protein
MNTSLFGHAESFLGRLYIAGLLEHWRARKKVIFPAPLLNSDIVGDAPILVQTGNSEISP